MTSKIIANQSNRHSLSFRDTLFLVPPPPATGQQTPAIRKRSTTPPHHRGLTLLERPTPINASSIALMRLQMGHRKLRRAVHRACQGPQRHLDRGFLLLALSSAALLLLLSFR